MKSIHPSISEYHDYERILRERASQKKGGIKNKQRIVQMSELGKVRHALIMTALCQEIAERDALITDFLRIYLLRISEVLSLNKKAFDWEKMQFTIFPYYEKNAKEKVYDLRLAPKWFIKNLKTYLRRYRHHFNHGYIFPSRSCQSQERPYIKAISWTHYRWNKAVAIAGVSEKRTGIDGRQYEKVRSHSFRKAGITNLIKKGVQIKKIAAFTQQHPQTIMIYYNMVDEEEARTEIMRDHIKELPLDY